MKKRWLPLIMLVCFGTCFIGGCGNSKVSDNKLNINGHDIVLKIGDTTYSADQLFGDMLSTEVGAQAAYEKILKMIVENSVETDANITASWDLMLESFEEKVKSKAASEGISESDARNSLLAEEGFASVEEKKESYIYEVKLSKIQESYWKENADKYYEEYLKNRLPYYVNHALVKTSYTANRGPYSSVISSDDATALHEIYSLLIKGEKFSYIMAHANEDTGSKSGKGYHMDLTTSFVTEFLHGVFVFDSILKGETSKVPGLTSDVLNFYASSADGESYGFNVIYASDIETLGAKASSSEYNEINTYDKNDKDESEKVGSISNSSTYGSASALYTRTVVFNQTFNNAGISVIAYDLNEQLPEGTYVVKNINGKDLKLLTDENGNIVFVVCARGSSSDLWVHFLTVGVSPFDEKVKLFFSMDQEKTIKDMIGAKKAELETKNNLSDTDINEILEEYAKELNSYETYVDIKSEDKTKQKYRNAIIEELETYVKTYAKRGITSGTVPGQDQFMTYDMVEYYMNDGKVTVKDETIKNLINEYINSQKALIDLQTGNEIANGWAEYYDRISLYASEEIQNKRIPMECSHGVNSGATCKYNYDEGEFEILITYKNVGSSNEYMPTDASTYAQSFNIGDGVIYLPGVGTDETNGMHRDGYTFEGWYTTSTFDEGTKVEYIDATRSSSKNKVILYAHFVENVEDNGGTE